MNRAIIYGLSVTPLSITLFAMIFFMTGTNVIATDNSLQSECPNWSASARECQMLNHIIKQNDWLICAEIHRNSHGYSHDGAWGKFELGVNVYQNFEQLKQICGEIP